jgi:thiamine-monophosphate kinase
MSSEFVRIARIARALGRADVTVGIGDDAAVIDDLVVTVDAQVEDVHFQRDWLSSEDIGYRAIVAAASDVFAMGGTPTAAVCAWTLNDIEEDAIERIATGQREAADKLGIAIVGGNLSRGPALSLTTTVLGRVQRPITRAGAKVGDVIAIHGAVGDAAVGLAALRAGHRSGRAVDVWRRPPIHRVDLGSAHAAIDISDGLGQDLGHMAEASEVAIVLDRVTVSDDLLELARSLGLDPEATALAGGEDYALVGAFEEAPPGFTVIGHVRKGEGVWIERDGELVSAPRGFRH